MLPPWQRHRRIPETSSAFSITWQHPLRLASRAKFDASPGIKLRTSSQATALETSHSKRSSHLLRPLRDDPHVGVSRVASFRNTAFR